MVISLTETFVPENILKFLFKKKENKTRPLWLAHECWWWIFRRQRRKCIQKESHSTSPVVPFRPGETQNLQIFFKYFFFQNKNWMTSKWINCMNVDAINSCCHANDHKVNNRQRTATHCYQTSHVICHIEIYSNMQIIQMWPTSGKICVTFIHFSSGIFVRKKRREQQPALITKAVIRGQSGHDKRRADESQFERTRPHAGSLIII